jgi:hypothetical protein
MDGLGRTSGAGKTITIGGKDFFLEPLTLRDFGVVEQHLLSKRPNPLKIVGEAAKDMPPEIAEQMFKAAYEDAKKGANVTTAEVTHFLDSFDGMSYTMYLMLRKKQPDLTQDDVYELLSQCTPEDIAQLQDDRDLVSGIDEAGN